jgi:murein DD-endopeptidase MepM/ murein hydrolase activator NlpD
MKKSFYISLLVITVTTIPTITFAGIVDDLKSKITNTGDQVKNIEKEIAAYNAKLKATQGEKDSLKKAITTLDINKQIVSKDLTLTKTKIENANATIVELDTGINQLNGKISTNKVYLKKSLQNMAVEDSLSKTDLISTILSADSISEAFDVSAKLANFQKSLLYHIGEVTSSRHDLEEVQQEKSAQRNELVDLNYELDAKKRIIEQTAIQKNELLKVTKNKEANYQTELKKRQETKRKLQQEMLTYEEQLRVTIDPNTIPKTGSKALSYPVSSIVITQYFGNTAFASQNSQVYSGQGHNGIDFSAPVGTRIKSAAAGVVQDTGDTDTACRGASYGKWVLVRHNNGLSTLYAHLSNISVSAGQGVSVGSLVGLSGNTGYSTGPHLHFTVYATKAVSVVTRQSKACGTQMRLPVSAQNGYLNPLSFF